MNNLRIIVAALCSAFFITISPAKAERIGVKYSDYPEQPSLAFMFDISDEPIDSNQITQDSTCYGKKVFFGTLWTVNRRNDAPIERHGFCWFLENREIVIEFSREFGDKGKSKTLRYPVSQFLAAGKDGQKLTIADLPVPYGRNNKRSKMERLKKEIELRFTRAGNDERTYGRVMELGNRVGYINNAIKEGGLTSDILFINSQHLKADQIGSDSICHNNPFASSATLDQWTNYRNWHASYPGCWIIDGENIIIEIWRYGDTKKIIGPINMSNFRDLDQEKIKNRSW